jgi:hypothetical protein
VLRPDCILIFVIAIPAGDARETSRRAVYAATRER